MGYWASKERVAVGLGRDRLRLLVARGNGSVSVAHSGSRALPPGALRGGLRAPVSADGEVIATALNELLDDARSDGLLRRRPDLVALVITDGSVKLAAAPIEGEIPGVAEGGRMARWVLRELLPAEADAARVDWTIMAAAGVGAAEPERWMLSAGGDAALLREYESLVEPFGWTVGRIVPWTLAAASVHDGAPGPEGESPVADQPLRRLILCEADGTLACMFEAGGVPRFHRAWRAQIAGDRVADELPSLRRYVNDHLEMTIGHVCLCGTADWSTAVADACDAVGLEVRRVDPEKALAGALRG
ncbi:MAG TPA: hypothetical protein QGG47_03795 [Acidobacteriota bacterium]|nr:hypothetical protein [Acidobacteriota bacterium]